MHGVILVMMRHGSHFATSAIPYSAFSYSVFRIPRFTNSLHMGDYVHLGSHNSVHPYIIPPCVNLAIAIDYNNTTQQWNSTTSCVPLCRLQKKGNDSSWFSVAVIEWTAFPSSSSTELSTGVVISHQPHNPTLMHNCQVWRCCLLTVPNGLP